MLRWAVRFPAFVNANNLHATAPSRSKPPRLVLIGGLVTCTLLTRVCVPAMHTIFDDMQNAFSRLLQQGREPRRLQPVEVVILRGRTGHQTTAHRCLLPELRSC